MEGGLSSSPGGLGDITIWFWKLPLGWKQTVSASGLQSTTQNTSRGHISTVSSLKATESLPIVQTAESPGHVAPHQAPPSCGDPSKAKSRELSPQHRGHLQRSSVGPGAAVEVVTW